MDFNFKSKTANLKINVKKELEDGTVVEKVLSFDCSPSNSIIIRKAVDAGKKLESIKMEDLEKMDFIDALEAASFKGKEAFEILAPGRWDEFFEYVEGDVEVMMKLLASMATAVRNKGVEQKVKSVISDAPDGAKAV